MDSRTASHRLTANAGIWAAATGGSRVLGLLRDLGIALLLGAGPVTDAFFLAFRLPDFLRRIFGEGVWSMLCVPLFTACGVADRHAGRQRHEQAFMLARTLLLWLLLLTGGACLLGMLLAPWFLGLLLVDAPSSELQTAVLLFRICAPYALLVMATALSVALLKAMGSFVVPALTPALLNLAMLLGLLLAWVLDMEPLAAATTLALSVLAGGLAQWLAQQPLLRARGFSWRGAWRLRDPEAARLGRQALPVLAGVSCLQICSLLATLLAMLLPAGGVSFLYYAERLAQLPIGLFSVAVSVASLPELAALAGRGRLREFGETLVQGLELVLWCSLPAALGLAALAGPIVELLFGHGAFGEQAVQGTASSVRALAAGLPALAAARPLAAACNAAQDRTTPLRATMAGVAVFCLSAWPCMELAAAPGLALSMSLAGWVNALLLFFVLRRRGLMPWNRESLRSLALSCALSLALFCLALGGGWLLRLLPLGSSLGTLLLILALAAGYLLASLALGVPAALRAWQVLAAKLHRAKD